jgi:D-alanine-D-alanine ligase
MAIAKIAVGVLRGGPSSEYDVSLKTGANVLRFLPKDKYRTIDLLMSKRGEWHMNGMPSTPDQIMRVVDVVFNAMHGEFGEDGKAQRIFEMYGVPFTGSASWPSFVAMNKAMARDTFQDAGIKVAPGVVVRAGEDLDLAVYKTIRKTASPWIIKPAKLGSSVGIYLANNPNELKEGIARCLAHDSSVLVERHIQGREATCAVMEDFRNERHYAFPVVEIIPPPGKKFFDFESKYDGRTQEIVPGRFDEKIKLAIQQVAIKAHTALRCAHYSRSDFIVARDGIYILETNTLPGLTSESLLPKAAAAVGLEFPHLLDHLVQLAMKTKRV